MDHDPPWSQFVVTINMPECIWAGRFVLSPLDYLVTENDPANIIHTAERGFNSVTLDTNSLLEERSADITYPSIGM